jgi:alcohol dehydrogenase class IV
MAGAMLYQQQQCDGIIAVGGGSPIDCAKGIAIVVSNGGHILDYEGIDRILYPMPPLICIPTTAGTAADISQFAIITDTSSECKIAIVSKTLVPDLALIDPFTTTTMNSQMTAQSGMDAMVHAVEAYVSTASSPFTDLQALDAIRLVAAHLPRVMQDGNNLEARYGMMLASTEAGMAFSNASLGAVHAMAHSLGGLLDSPHGECNALLLEHVVAYNFNAAPERYTAVAAALGCPVGHGSDDDICQRLVAAVRTLRNNSGITGSLAERGVTREIIPQLAEKAMHDACMVTNPRRPVQADIEAVYAQAL